MKTEMPEQPGHWLSDLLKVLRLAGLRLRTVGTGEDDEPEEDLLTCHRSKRFL